jgi:hypothetical protein
MEGRPDETERVQPAQLRVSDEDRHKVAEVLRRAAGEGRLDLEELDERLEAAYAAKTYGDLVPLTVDLPVHAGDGLPTPATGGGAVAAPGTPGSALATAETYQSSLSFMGDCTRRGVWRVPARHTAFSLMGGVTLDLREAVFEAPEVTIDAVAIMAGIDIYVNAHTRVIVEGVGIMGDFSQARDKVPAEITASSPVVRVKGMALMAGVNVRRKPMPGEPRKRLRG